MQSPAQPKSVSVRRVIDADAVRHILRTPRYIEQASEYPLDALVPYIETHETRGGVLYDGEPIAAGGITTVKPGLALAWLVASRDLRPYAGLVYREVRRALSETPAGITVVADVTVRLEVPERFIKKLGFAPIPYRLSGRTQSYYRKAT